MSRKPYPYTRCNSDSVRYERRLRRMHKARPNPDARYYTRVEATRNPMYWIKQEYSHEHNV